MNEKALLTTEDMYQADRQTIAAGTPGVELMENAGAAVVREVTARWERRQVVVLCGPGNNGGDGFVVARLFSEIGWPVTLALLGSVSALSGDAAVNGARWSGEIHPVEPGVLDGSPLVIDAMFGAGLTRQIIGPALECINAINKRNLECVAIDVPSGLNGNSGEPMGAVPRCALTVTFFRAKPGHFMMPGRDLSGELVVADIGIQSSVLQDLAPKTYLNGTNLWLHHLPWPTLNTHKYNRGHVSVRGGEHMTGAAQLAALGARRMGAGLVTISTPSMSANIYRSAMPGNLVATADTVYEFSEYLDDPRINVVLIGPGLGTSIEAHDFILAALETNKRVVLDADALTSFASAPETLLSKLNENHILTPHEGEFSRLFQVEGDKLSRARKAAALCGATILLKGADTVIAHPDGHTVINASGTPFLATAGSGDVLAGIISGLMAQGMTPFSAACAGAWVHGRAGELFGPGLIAEDLVDTLPDVLDELYLTSH
jgi:hydroxyethylthiazole kinase-like uncharacterized protein yjeF